MHSVHFGSSQDSLLSSYNLIICTVVAQETSGVRSLYNPMDSVRLTNAMVTCEIKLFQNYFSLRRHPSEIILQLVETCLKLFENCFGGLSRFVNIFQHIQCR